MEKKSECIINKELKLGELIKYEYHFKQLNVSQLHNRKGSEVPYSKGSMCPCCLTVGLKEAVKGAQVENSPTGCFPKQHSVYKKYDVLFDIECMAQALGVLFCCVLFLQKSSWETEWDTRTLCVLPFPSPLPAILLLFLASQQICKMPSSYNIASQTT